VRNIGYLQLPSRYANITAQLNKNVLLQGRTVVVG
jgi:hypothetical protein